ncbi:MAG: aspartate kinase [Deltaproteobacteria bacterium]|nr:aspartate kinase [Deltaproteobacteria bacterium]
MSLIVQKFGGTSVADLVRIQEVAKRVAKTYDAGNQVAVVLSAMAGVTDHLIQMAEVLTDTPDKRELDVLMATGEQTTVALLAIALKKMGYKAKSLLGHQVRVLTDSSSGSARILDISGDAIRDLLDKGYIAVVAGFQGSDAMGNITTLGRGGSDTSAVAIAAAVNADVCEIYTDVDGVYTADPNVVPKARKLSTITYDVMLEMSGLGAKVLQIRSVEFAKKFGVPVHVRSSFNEDRDMERMVVAGVTVAKSDARITITKVPDQPGIAARIFQAVADAGISVDMIIQNTRSGNMTDVTFTVPGADYKQALEIEKKVAEEIGAEDVAGDENIAKVSITGVGMKSHPGVAARMFRALSEEGINILMISTSEIRISCVVEQKYAELAARVLHTEFGLDKKDG